MRPVLMTGPAKCRNLQRMACCAGWQPQPMRGGVAGKSRPTRQGSGWPWRRPSVRALRGMVVTAGASGPRHFGLRGRWASDNRPRATRSSTRPSEGGCRRSGTRLCQSRPGKPITSSGSRRRGGTACLVWCVSPCPLPKSWRRTSALSNISFATTIARGPTQQHYLCSTTLTRAHGQGGASEPGGDLQAS